MKITDIEQQWAIDCKIDSTDLTKSSVETGQLHHKYNTMINRAKSHWYRLRSDRAVLTLNKRDWLSGEISHQQLKDLGWRPNARMVLKADIEMHLQADPDMININSRIADIEQIIAFLDSIIKTINNRGFVIKNIIDDRKFMNGGY